MNNSNITYKNGIRYLNVSGQPEENNEPEQQNVSSTKEDTQLQILLRIGQEAALFHTDTGELYARVPHKGHYEVLSISERGGGFRRWLTYRYFEEKGSAASATAMTQAMEIFTARADMASDLASVYTRIAYQDGTLYLDLGTEDWQAVKITPEGWQVVKEYPVYFRRPNGIKALPIPQRGGSLADLKTFINVASEDDWKMLVAWILGAFHPKGPYPILAISGEQGTAKSSATRYLRELIDPNSAPVRDTPRDARDLVIAAKNGRVLALDNLSGMPQWLSDALCRMATGSGYGTRALYANDEEALFNDRRPIVFNGIEELTSRGDLADRSLILSLLAIDPSARKTETKLDAMWEQKHPLILGAVLDAVCGALAGLPHVKLNRVPRMADLAYWVCAAEKSLGWKKGSFMEAYDRNRESAIEAEIEASPIASSLMDLMEENTTWKGTASELHAALQHILGDQNTFLPGWPKSPNALTGKLKRLAPALRASGIHITTGSSNGKRYIEIHRRDSDDLSAKSDGKSDDSDDLLTHSDDLFHGDRHCQKGDFKPYEGKNDPQSDGSDDLFPALSNLRHERKEREEREIDKPGKSSSLSSLSSLQTSGECQVA